MDISPADMSAQAERMHVLCAAAPLCLTHVMGDEQQITDSNDGLLCSVLALHLD